eukprot:201132_1
MAFSWKRCLLFTCFSIVAILFQFPWIAWLCLATAGAIIVLSIVIWCVYQTVHILKWDQNKPMQVPHALSTSHREYRESTYTGYATGWYPLCWSREVKRGQVIQVNALGKSFAIFRGDMNGEIGILNAFCPHLGASLVASGEVCDDMLICAFHKWAFDKHGTCTDIPYFEGKTIPQSAHTKCYNSIEYHDMICVYYAETHNDMKPTAIPMYNLPTQHHLLDTTKYAYIGCHDYGVVQTHIREFAENAADWAHFAGIHGKMMFPFTQIEIPFISRWLSIHHTPATHIGGRNKNNEDYQAIEKNKYGPNDKHFLYFINRSMLQWNGKDIPRSGGNSRITFCGPAGICIFKFVIPAYDPNEEIVLFHTHLPMDKMHLRVRFHWYASKKLPRLLVWYVVGNWISQWTNDIEIWENKIFLDKPCLVKGDGPIMKMRRWYKQFYPEERKKDKGDKICINAQEKTKSENASKKTGKCDTNASKEDCTMDW